MHQADVTDISNIVYAPLVIPRRQLSIFRSVSSSSLTSRIPHKFLLWAEIVLICPMIGSSASPTGVFCRRTNAFGSWFLETVEDAPRRRSMDMEIFSSSTPLLWLDSTNKIFLNIFSQVVKILTHWRSRIEQLVKRGSRMINPQSP